MTEALQKSRVVTYSKKDDLLQALARDTTLKHTTLRIAIVMLGFVNHETGQAWPSQKRLAETTGINERTVLRSIQALEEAGYITVIRGNGRGSFNRYMFHLDQPKTAEIIPLHPDEMLSQKGDKTCTEQGQKGDKTYKKGCQKLREKGDTGVTLTSINKTNKYNQYAANQKLTTAELEEMALRTCENPIQPTPKNRNPDHIVTRDSQFWTDWLFAVQHHHANPAQSRAAVVGALERGWIPAKSPYPKHLQGTPRAAAYEASLEVGLSEGACGSFRG